MNDVLTSVISGVTAILVAWITASQYKDKRERERRHKITDEREALKEQRDLLSLEYMDATAKAAIACSRAIIDHTLNGELKAATDKLKEAGKNNDSFLKEQGLKKIC